MSCIRADKVAMTNCNERGEIVFEINNTRYKLQELIDIIQEFKIKQNSNNEMDVQYRKLHTQYKELNDTLKKIKQTEYNIITAMGVFGFMYIPSLLFHLYK